MPIPSRSKNVNRQARRKASWQRGVDRCQARREAQDQRRAANVAARAAGDPTPWEKACEKAKLKKAKQKASEPNIVRSKAGNILTDITVVDEHGPITIKGIRPCCDAKSYAKCDHNPGMSAHMKPWELTKLRFYFDIYRVPK
jgi:hypothetical protein